MPKTILQIANEIGIDKQKVYRYIKKHNINEAHQDSGTMYYNEMAETLIKQYFTEKNCVNEAYHDIHQCTSETHQSTSNDTVIDTVITMLQYELQAKNQLIEEQQQIIKELNTTIRIQAESINAAHHNELAETIIDGQQTIIPKLSDKTEKKQSFFKRLFKKSNSS